MSTPFLYSEQFIETLKSNTDPKTNLNDFIKESIQDGNGNKLFTLNLPNSKNGDLLPELVRGLMTVSKFYKSMIEVADFGLDAIRSPEWMIVKVSDHIAVLSLYKAYLDEVAVQAVRQSYFEQEEEAKRKLAETNLSELLPNLPTEDTQHQPLEG
jgi:hypothetical protein